MIFQLIFTIVYSFLSLVTSWLPSADPLPWGLDDIFSTMVMYYRGAVDTLPYLGVVFDAFLILVAFEIGMLLVKLILGSRAPNHIN